MPFAGGIAMATSYQRATVRIFPLLISILLLLAIAILSHH